MGTTTERPSIISKALADKIDEAIAISGPVPHDADYFPGERNCIDPQLKLKPKGLRAKGWHDIDPKRMCASCACEWHLLCARNFALGVVR